MIQKPLLFAFITLIGFSCSNNKNFRFSAEKVKNSQWLVQKLGDCIEIYTFQDSTFEESSCEIPDSFRGIFWMVKDTLFLLIPKPEKMNILIDGDSLKINVQIGHSNRPTLEKMILKNDTLFFYEIINNYNQNNLNKITEFEINYMTRLEKRKTP
jgi:hypothetical protein